MDDLKKITDASWESKGIKAFADEDWMELVLDLKKGVRLDDAYELLNSKRVVHGIDNHALEALVAEANSEGGAKGVVAKGVMPKYGTEGKLEFLIDMNEAKVRVTDDQGNADYRDSNMIKEVFSGQEIVKVIPPTIGEEGINILGRKTSTFAGAKSKIRLGKNTRLDEAKNIIYATTDGHVEWEAPLISVQETFTVFKDIDLSIGNLKFIGGLRIEGNVPPGYTLDSGRDIFITGTCNSSNLLAKGDITVEAGITGSEGTKILCDGKLSAKFINEAKVVTRGGVEAFYEIVRSNIRTMGTLVLMSGSIRGGETYAFEGITAREIGAPMGTPTFVAVGLDFSVDEKIEKLNQAKTKMEEEQKKLETAIAPFMKNKLLLMKAPANKQAAVKTILKKIEDFKKKCIQIDDLIQKQEGSRYNRTKEIKILAQIKEDVTVAIGKKQKTYSNNRTPQRCILCYDKQSFEIVTRRFD